MELPNHHEALIPEDQFERVQLRFAANSRNKSNDKEGPSLSSPRSAVSPNPLSGRIKCGLCGSNMTVTKKTVLTCSRKKNSGKAHCNKTDVPLFETLELITAELCDRVVTEETINEQIAILEKDAHSDVQEEAKRKERVRQRLRTIEKERNNLMDLAREYGTTDHSLADKFMADLQKLWVEEESLNLQLSSISEEMAELETFMSNRSNIITVASQLKTYLYSEDQPEKREFLRLFIKEVDLFDEKQSIIEYRLPLPNTMTEDGKHTSEVNLLDEKVLLQHAALAA